MNPKNKCEVWWNLLPKCLIKTDICFLLQPLLLLSLSQMLTWSSFPPPSTSPISLATRDTCFFSLSLSWKKIEFVYFLCLTKIGRKKSFAGAFCVIFFFFFFFLRCHFWLFHYFSFLLIKKIGSTHYPLLLSSQIRNGIFFKNITSHSGFVELGICKTILYLFLDWLRN